MSWGSRTHYHPIVIDHTLVGSGVPGGFTGLLTKACILDEVMDADGDHPAKSDGGDVLIASVDDGTGRFALDLIDFTQDNTPGSATAQIAYRDADGIWAPSSVADVTIYFGWGDAASSQPAASADYGSDDAYDIYWKGFWPNGSTTDRTANNTDLTAVGAPGTAAGKVGTAWDLDGSTQYLEAATPVTDEPVTLLAWVNPDVNNAQMTTMSVSSNAVASDNAWALLFRGTTASDPITGFITASSSAAVYDIGNFSIATWYLAGLVMVSDTSRYGYVSGTLSAENTTSKAIGTPDILDIGVLYDDSSSAYGNHWNGLIDSPSIHNTNRSEAWLDTWYAQTNTPGDFHTPGTAVELGGTTAELAASIEGEGDVTGAASGTAGAAASIEGDGDLTGQASGTAAGAATVEGEGDATGSATGTAGAAATLEGEGDVAGAASGIAGGAASIEGEGDITGQPSGIASGAATLEGEGDVTGAPIAATIADIAASIEGEGDVVGAVADSPAIDIKKVLLIGSRMVDSIVISSPMLDEIEIESRMVDRITVGSRL